jgi:type IV pilus assembly protein PilW
MLVGADPIVQKIYSRKKDVGLSLIELMVAIAIGAVLSLGAVTLFMQSKLSYLQDEESARLQENGRYAMRYISHELSMAGFLGGVLGGDLLTSTPTGGTDCFDYLMGVDRNSFPLEHFNNVSSASDPNMPTTCWDTDDTFVNDPNTPAPDVLVFRRTRDRATDPNEPGVSLEADKFYVRILDANVSTTIVQGGTSGALLDWWEYSPQILFVRDHSTDDTTDGIPTLCRIGLSPDSKDKGPTECLVEGVENIQIEFGIDDDEDQQANYFVTEPSEAQLGAAVAARLYLLVRSVSPIAGYTNDKTFTLGQTEVNAPADGFYRRVLQTTVLLRNSEAYKF